MPRALLTARETPVYVDLPSVVEWGASTLLIGSPTLIWETRSAISDTTHPPRPYAGIRLGVGVRTDGTADTLPTLATSTLPLMPLGARVSDGVLVAWATSADSSEPQSPHRNAVWISSLSRGRWSPPRMIWRSSIVRWHPGSASVLRVVGEPIVVFPAADSTARPAGGVVLAERRRGAWTNRWIGIGDLAPIAVSALAGADGSVLIAGVGDVRPSTDSLPNAIYVVRVPTAIAQRAPMVTRLRQFSREWPSNPLLLRLGATVHVLWRHRGDQRSGSDSLMDAVSLDDGRSWSRPTATALAGRYRDLRVLPDGDRAATIVMVDELTSDVALLEYDAGRWVVSPQRFVGALSLPSIAMVGDRVTVMYGVADRADSLTRVTSPPRLMLSSRARCERHGQRSVEPR